MAERGEAWNYVRNGIRYVQRYGIPWDAMPKDLPPPSICYDFWRLLADQRHIERMNHLLVMADREKAGREASSTLAIVVDGGYKGRFIDGVQN